MANVAFVKKALMTASATVMTLISGKVAQAITFYFAEFSGFDHAFLKLNIDLIPEN